jgi:hypothetical protein
VQIVLDGPSARYSTYAPDIPSISNRSEVTFTWRALVARSGSFSSVPIHPTLSANSRYAARLPERAGSRWKAQRRPARAILGCVHQRLTLFYQ